MSTSRIPKEAGWVNKNQLARGPNGRALCRQCGNEVPKGRQTFCGDGCVHEWKCRTDPGYQARQVLARDRGICRACGLDCISLLAELKLLRRQAREEFSKARRLPLHWVNHEGPYGSLDDNLQTFNARLDELDLRNNYRSLTRRLWEMDHIVPVVEGGGSCGLDNLRTLCWKCHREATTELSRRRANKKKAAKLLAPEKKDDSNTPSNPSG